MSRRLILGMMLTLAVLALPASGLTRSRASSAGGDRVSATLTISGKGLHTRMRLKIALNGASALDQTVKSSACPPGCVPIAVGGSRSPLRVVALRKYAVPDVVLGLYSGGAHCCFVDQVYSLDQRTGTFRKIEHDFADSGARVQDLGGNGNFEFLSSDPRILDAGFTDFAHSAAPLQIWTVSGGKFRDITRSYRARLRTDAAKWLRAFHRQHGNGRGLIAAWAADEDLLGHPGLVSSELAGALKAGHLGVPASFGGPSPARFVVQLQALLRRLGYTR
jgi:hypothetical protein